MPARAAATAAGVGSASMKKSKPEPMSALLLGLVPVVGGNVLPIDILSLSFWIAEGIICLLYTSICDTPANIWNQTKEYSGVTKSFVQQYYTGKDKGVALKIKECKQYKEAVDPTTVIANFKVPQSFIYV